MSSLLWLICGVKTNDGCLKIPPLILGMALTKFISTSPILHTLRTTSGAHTPSGVINSSLTLLTRILGLTGLLPALVRAAVPLLLLLFLLHFAQFAVKLDVQVQVFDVVLERALGELIK